MSDENPGDDPGEHTSKGGLAHLKRDLLIFAGIFVAGIVALLIFSVAYGEAGVLKAFLPLVLLLVSLGSVLIAFVLGGAYLGSRFLKRLRAGHAYGGAIGLLLGMFAWYYVWAFLMHLFGV